MAKASMDESALVQQWLQRVSVKDNMLDRAAWVLDQVAHNSVGLGEVLQDYARQASTQLHDLIHAAENVANGTCGRDDIESLRHAPMILKSAGMVLERTPVAMRRNKANTIGGERESCLSDADIAQLAHAFSHAPEVTWLSASEEAGQAWAASITDTPITSASIIAFPASPLHS